MGACCCRSSDDDSDDEEEDRKRIDITRLTYEQRQKIANEELEKRMEKSDSPLGTALSLVEKSQLHNLGSIDKVHALWSLMVVAKKEKSSHQGPSHFSKAEMLENTKALVGIENRILFIVDKLREAVDAIKHHEAREMTNERNLNLGAEELAQLLPLHKEWQAQATWNHQFKTGESSSGSEDDGDDDVDDDVDDEEVKHEADDGDNNEIQQSDSSSYEYVTDSEEDG